MQSHEHSNFTLNLIVNSIVCCDFDDNFQISLSKKIKSLPLILAFFQIQLIINGLKQFLEQCLGLERCHEWWHFEHLEQVP